MTDYDVLAQLVEYKLGLDKKKGYDKKGNLKNAATPGMVAALQLEDCTGINAHAMHAFLTLAGKIRR